MSKLNLTLMQTHLLWEDRPANLSHFDNLLDSLEENERGSLNKTDLILLPEMFSTGFSMRSDQLAEPMNGPTLGWLAEKAAKLRATLCGSVIIEEEGKFYNRLIWMRPDQTFETYDKRHLFRMSNEHKNYASGSERLVVEINGFRICPMVCYDLRFPVWSRNSNDYDLALYVANWPAARSGHWQTLLAARAIENLCYVAGLNRIGKDGNDLQYSGDSGVYNFQGEKILALESADTTATLSLSFEALQQYRNEFPAHRDADEFTLTP